MSSKEKRTERLAGGTLGAAYIEVQANGKTWIEVEERFADYSTRRWPGHYKSTHTAHRAVMRKWNEERA